MRLVLFLSFILSACGQPVVDPPHMHTHPDITQLTFKAKVGADDFDCARTYQVGTPKTQYTPRDFRLYVHDVVFTNSAGDVPFTLGDDGVFQNGGVALLDFENKTGGCSSGTAETHTILTGTAKGDHYSSVSFTLGVPFEKNHQDAAAAAAPLSSTAMFWSWNAGYKFLKVDGATTGLPNGHNIHVGSTGCQAGTAPNSVMSCTAPNRVRVTVALDPMGQAVLLDLAALVANSNLDTNMAMSAPGCMSGGTDADCAPIFASLGLPFGTTAATTPTFFKAE